MDRVRIGNTFRAIRLELHLRQADVAARAGVSRQTVSTLECGRIDSLSIHTYCRLAETIDADVSLVPRWRGSKLDRLLDRRHAQLQNRVVELLTSLGWAVRTEFSFNHYGDRGSVDILAWQPGMRALLVGEIKTEIVSLEETLRVMDMKRRIVPVLAGRDLGWNAVRVASILVLPATSTQRAMVDRHSGLVTASLPERTWAVCHWLEEPLSDIRGVWFLQNSSHAGAKALLAPTRRVRRSSPPGSGR